MLTFSGKALRSMVNCCLRAEALMEQFTLIDGFGNWTKNRLHVDVTASPV